MEDLGKSVGFRDGEVGFRKVAGAFGATSESLVEVLQDYEGFEDQVLDGV